MTSHVFIVSMDKPDQSRSNMDVIVKAEEAIWQRFIAHTKNNIPFERLCEENELALCRFESNIRGHKKNVLAAIKRDFFLSQNAPDVWKLYKDTIARIKAYNMGHMANDFAHVNDFTGTSSKILLYIDKKLRKKGINPSSILLQDSFAEQPEQCVSGMLVNVKNPTIALKFFDKKITLDTQDVKSGQFILCPALLNRSYEEQKAFCSSMVYWFVTQQATTKYVLFKILRHIMKLDDDTILTNNAWRALVFAQMDQAVIIPCLKKEKLMAGTWQFFNHADSSFTLELFAKVCRVNTLLKQKAWLRDNNGLLSVRLAPIMESLEETEDAEGTSRTKSILEVLEKMYDK